MANMYTILGSLRSELEGRIRALDPNGLSNTRFTFRPTRERPERDIRDCTGKNRLYELDLNPTRIEERSVGSVNKIYRVDVPLVGIYQRTPDWQRAAIDDLDSISKDLNQNASPTTGVHIREIDIEQPYSLTNHEADNWMIAVAVVMVILETN